MGGSGIEELEEVAAELEDKYPGSFKAVLSFKGTEKYKTYAAADFALMPSRYEPCGLVQMEGMRFGTLPIVAPTGGLTDTVTDGKMASSWSTRSTRTASRPRTLPCLPRASSVPPPFTSLAHEDDAGRGHGGRRQVFVGQLRQAVRAGFLRPSRLSSIVASRILFETPVVCGRCTVGTLLCTLINTM